MRYSLEGTVVGQTQKWALNGYSISHEWGAQYVQPHQKPKWTILAGRGHACSLKCHDVMLHNADLIAKGRFVAVRSSFA